MTKEEKINYIKYWLQRFGERDADVFSTEVVIDNISWSLLLQYNFDSTGIQINPFDWCNTGNKLIPTSSISDRTEEELDRIIIELKK